MFFFFGDKLILFHLLLKTIFKTHQVTPETHHFYHHLSQLLTQTHTKSLPGIFLQLAYFFFRYCPYHNLILEIYLLASSVQGVETDNRNIQQVSTLFIVSFFWCIDSVRILSIQFLFYFYQTKIKNKQTGPHVDRPVSGDS